MSIGANLLMIFIRVLKLILLYVSLNIFEIDFIGTFIAFFFLIRSY
jgi:hypothetical protein